MTPLTFVYEAFFALITDDMYMEITKEETEKDCFGLLLASLPLYEFPTKVIDIDLNQKEPCFNRELTLEEINILAFGMVQVWLERQIHSVELVRQKCTGTDFKMTSQAAHLSSLVSLLQEIKDEHRRLQLLQSRRHKNGDHYESTFGLMVKKLY